MSETHDENDSPLQLFSGGELAATFEEIPSRQVQEDIRMIAGVEGISVLFGDEGIQSISPTGLVESVRLAVSEERRPIEHLTDVLEDDGAVVIVRHNGADSTVSNLASQLTEKSAGWVFHFDELTWTEMSSPQSPHPS